MSIKKISNYSWKSYINTFNHNIDVLSSKQTNVPYKVIRIYSKLLTFYPIDEKTEKLFFSLIPSNRITILFKHLIKTCKKNNISNTLINELINNKNKYNNLFSSKYSKKEEKERIILFISTHNYDKLIELKLKKILIQEQYNKLINFTNLLINMLIDDEIHKIRLNNNNNKKQITKESGIKTSWIIDDFSYNYNIPNEITSYNDILKDIFTEVSQIDDVINNEVDRRIKIQNTNNKNKCKKSKLSDSKYSHSIKIGEIPHPTAVE
jgi:hypothetical protein